MELDPENVDALMGLANRMIGLKRLEDGIILLERALKAEPDDEAMVRQLAELYPEIGAPELSPEVAERVEAGQAK